jgi:hypothetical protein
MGSMTIRRCSLVRNINLAGGVAQKSARMLDARLDLERVACKFSAVGPQLVEYRSRLKVCVDSCAANGHSWRCAT